MEHTTASLVITRKGAYAKQELSHNPCILLQLKLCVSGCRKSGCRQPFGKSLDAQFAKLDKVLPVSLCVGYVVRSSVAGPLQHPLLT